MLEKRIVIFNFARKCELTKKLAQEEGLEPPTKRLTAACSTS
jgi:hypothetical protein